MDMLMFMQWQLFVNQPEQWCQLLPKLQLKVLETHFIEQKGRSCAYALAYVNPHTEFCPLPVQDRQY